MEGKTYKFGFKGAQETIKLQKYAMLIMAATIFVLVIGVMQKRERLVIMPPVSDERMELAYDSANEPYYKAFALYVASFLGNINPANATFVKEGLSLSFSPQLYAEMQAKITEDAEKMRISGRSIRFYADRVLFESETGKTFVAGKQEIVSAAGNIHDQDVCYEMQVVIRDGIPQVAKFAYYTGAPRTEEWLQRNRHTQTAAANRD
jgi:type IV conjugative transfer system protein TraE